MSKSPGIEISPVRCPPLAHEPLTSDQSVQAAAVFKALADPVRLQLFSLIASHEGGQAYVCDISPAVDVSQPTVSHHLKVLRTAGLIESERHGSWVHYRIVPAALDIVAAIVAPLTGKALE